MANTIARQSDLSNLRLRLEEVGDTEFQLRLGHAWVVSSRKCFDEVFCPYVISFFSTRQELRDHRPSGSSGPFLSAMCFVSATLRHAVCGAWS